MSASTLAGGLTLAAPGVGTFTGRPKVAMAAPASGERPREVSAGCATTSTRSTMVPFCPSSASQPTAESMLNGSSVTFVSVADLPFASKRTNAPAAMKLSGRSANFAG